MGQLGQTNQPGTQTETRQGAKTQPATATPNDLAIDVGPKLSPETRCLHALAIDGASVDRLRQKFIAVSPMEPIERYTPDPDLPPIGNKIRRLIPDPKKYFSRMPDANNITTVVHEEYHHVNSIAQNKHAKLAADIHIAAYTRKIEEKIANRQGPSAEVVKLTDDEIAALPNTNSFSIYLPDFDTAVTLHETNVPKMAARKHIPEQLWGDTAKHYVETMKDSNPSPGHLFDEGMAYIVDGRAAISLIQDSPSRSKDDARSRFDTLRLFFRDRNPLTNSASRIGDQNPFSGATSTGLELTVSLLAHAKAVHTADSAYFNSSGYKELCAYIIKENIRTYEAGAVFPVFRSKETESYYKALMTEQAGEELRAFARQAFGEKWYSEVFAKKTPVISAPKE